MGLAKKQMQYKKNIQNCEKLFPPTFETLLHRRKYCGPFRIHYNWSTVLKIFFSDNTSAIAHLHGCVLAELWLTQHSNFIKDFVSLKMKNIYCFDVSPMEIALFLFKLAIYKFLPMKLSKTQKDIIQMYFFTF